MLKKCSPSPPLSKTIRYNGRLSTGDFLELVFCVFSGVVNVVAVRLVMALTLCWCWQELC